jgi:putative addiction module component (TIGR02574 family)
MRGRVTIESHEVDVTMGERFMSSSVPSSVLETVLGLPPDSRAELVDKLLESLTASPDPSIEAEWMQEIEARVDAYERGETTSISAEQMLAEFREKWRS